MPSYKGSALEMMVFSGRFNRILRPLQGAGKNDREWGVYYTLSIGEMQRLIVDTGRWRPDANEG
jgi:hypothetical protein